MNFHNPSIRLATLFLFSLSCFLIQMGCSHQTRKSPTVNPKLKQEVESALEPLAETIQELGRLEVSVMETLLKEHLRQHSFLYSAAFAYAPRQEGGQIDLIAPYINRKNGDFTVIDLGSELDYTDSDVKWFTAPLQEKQAVWSVSTLGETESEMMTYSIPIYVDTQKEELIGVLTSSLKLDESSLQ